MALFSWKSADSKAKQFPPFKPDLRALGEAIAARYHAKSLCVKQGKPLGNILLTPEQLMAFYNHYGDHLACYSYTGECGFAHDVLHLIFFVPGTLATCIELVGMFSYSSASALSEELAGRSMNAGNLPENLQELLAKSESPLEEAENRAEQPESQAEQMYFPPQDSESPPEPAEKPPQQAASPPETASQEQGPLEELGIEGLFQGNFIGKFLEVDVEDARRKILHGQFRRVYAEQLADVLSKRMESPRQHSP